MKKSKSLLVIKDVLVEPTIPQGTLGITPQELHRWIKTGALLRHILRYKSAKLFTSRLENIASPLIWGVLLRMLSNDAVFIGENGNQRKITLGYLAACAYKLLSEVASAPRLLYQTHKQVRNLRKNILPCDNLSLNLARSPAYLRSDLWFAVRAGGSVGHIAGVINNMKLYGSNPRLVTTAAIPTVSADIQPNLVVPDQKYLGFRELSTIWFNRQFFQKTVDYIGSDTPSFVYQRYSINNYSGVATAQHYKVPFVLEYNGSEIWVKRNWDKRLRLEKLAQRIEMLNLEAADVIVVVSSVLRDELVDRGIIPDKILVNPNGVDTDVYTPEISGELVREKHYLKGKIVLGFIGTFGHWHGAENLAQAFGELLKTYPEYKERVRLLMIGDGVMMPLVKEHLSHYQVEKFCVLTGIVNQDEGPEYLAACDILVSPHVPNPDGTRFFGSPTKLFEYMAMGKGIVASRLEQIGEVLDDGKTALMVEPGDILQLVQGMKLLIDDEGLRQELGSAARQEAVKNYTWKAHTHRIIEKLRQRCG